MAESTVSIKIDIDARTAGIDRVRQKLTQLATEAKAVDRSFNDMTNRSEKLNRSMVDLDKEVRSKEKDFDKLTKGVDKNADSFDKLEKETKKTEKTLSGFGKFIKKLASLFLKGFAISLALTIAALISINLAFKAGAWLAKAWGATVTFALKAAAAAGATVVTVFAALAAAQKQYIAATQASRYGGGLAGLARSSSAMRSLSSNTQLAVFGAEALQGAFAAISQKTRLTGGLVTALEAMGDFIAASGDPKKALAAAGQFLGELNSKGKLTGDIMKAAAEIGPEFEKAVKEAQKKGITTSGAFMKALVGGDLSKEVEGQLGLVNMTLIGTFKRNFELIKTQFADFGQPMLKPFTEATERLSRSFRVFFMSIMGSVREFATGTLLTNLESMIQRTLFWMAKVFNEYLPQVDGMLKGIKDWVRSVGDGWDRMVEKLRPLVEGGQILIDTFKPFLKGIFGGFGRGLYEFNDLVKENKEEFLDFGEALANLFGGVARMFGRMKEDFVKLLPVLTKLVNLMADVLNLIVDVMTGIAAVGGVFGSALNAGLFGMAFVAGGKGGKVGQGIRNRMGGRRGGGGTPPAGGMGGPTPSGPGFGGGVGGGPLAMTGTQHISANVVNITAAVVNVMGGMGAGPYPAGAGYAVNRERPVAGSGGNTGWSYWGNRNAGGPTPSGRPDWNRWNPTQTRGQRFRAGLGRAGSRMRGFGAGIGSRMGGGIGSAGLMAGSILVPVAGGMLEDVGVAGAGGGSTILGGAMMAKSMGMGGAKLLPGAGAAAAGFTAGSIMAKGVLGISGMETLGNKTHSAVGVGSGALAGAAIGSIIPGIGTAAGAAIGAIAGGIGGYIQSSKFKKQAKERAQQFAGGYDEAIKERLSVGDAKGAQTLLAQMKAEGHRAAANSQHIDSFNEEFDKLSSQIEAEAQPRIEEYNKNVAMLSDKTGMTADEVKRLADTVGLDLTKAIDDVGGAVSALTGLPAFKTLMELQTFVSGTLGESMINAFTQPQQFAQAREAVFEAGQVVREQAAAGGVSEAAVGNLLLSSYEHDLMQGLTPVESLRRLSRAYGAGGEMYGAGFQLEGMETAVGPKAMALIGNQVAEYIGSDAFAAIAQEISLSLGLNNPQGVQDAALASLTGMSSQEKLDQLSRLLDFAEGAKQGRYGKATGKTAGPIYDLIGLTGEKNFLQSTGINLVDLFNPAGANAVAETAAGDATTEIQAAFETYQLQTVKIGDEVISGTADFIKQYYASNPPALGGTSGTKYPQTPVDMNGDGYRDKDGKWIGGGDTTSSRLMNTLSKHGMYNSMLPGKRMITSSLRNTNLGSLGSDHATGNAYDLVGQNLVSYANMVNQSGGFAEFHGGIKDRHLHVVPGAGPVGDTMAPIPSVAPATTAQTSTQNSYQIVVNPPMGSSPQEIADAVMQRIYREQRSARERQ